MGGDGVELTLGERIAAERSAKGKAARLASSLARFAHTEAPRAVAHPCEDNGNAKKKGKHAPREISSRRAVPLGRYRCLGESDDNNNNGEQKKKWFDPRFSDHCGTLLEGHVDRNFSFVENMVDKERYYKEEALKALKNANNEYSELEAEVRALKKQIDRRQNQLKRKDLENRLRANEKELVRCGAKKSPFFFKKKHIREAEMQEKFIQLKKSGAIKKFIEKKRRRTAAKDRKKLLGRR